MLFVYVIKKNTAMFSQPILVKQEPLYRIYRIKSLINIVIFLSRIKQEPWRVHKPIYLF